MNNRPQGLQNIFNHVVTFQRKQGIKAVNAIGGICRYKTTLGLKCAAGCTIPEEDYSPEFEGASIKVGNYTCAVGNYFNSHYSPDEVEFICKLQKVHDHAEISRWERDWENLADLYHLTMPPKTNELA